MEIEVGANPDSDMMKNRAMQVASDITLSFGFIWVVAGLHLIDAATKVGPVRFIVAQIKDNWGWKQLTTDARENGAVVLAPGQYNMGEGGGILAAFYISWLRAVHGMTPKTGKKVKEYQNVETFFTALFKSKAAATLFVEALIEGDFLRIGLIDDTGTPAERLAMASKIMEGGVPSGLNSIRDFTLDHKWFKADTIALKCDTIPDLISLAFKSQICKVRKGGKPVFIADPSDYL